MAKRLTKEIKDMADEIRHMTIEEARNLKGFLSRTVPAFLEYHGWYSYTLVKDDKSEKKILIIKA
jgi:hypothetical protein